MVQRCRVHANANFVLSKGYERTLHDPQVFQSERVDLCDAIHPLLGALICFSMQQLQTADGLYVRAGARKTCQR